MFQTRHRLLQSGNRQVEKHGEKQVRSGFTEAHRLEEQAFELFVWGCTNRHMLYRLTSDSIQGSFLLGPRRSVGI